MDQPILRTGIFSEPIDVTAAWEAVGGDRAGAVAVFIGTVRDHDDGREVSSLSYEAHPHAAGLLLAVVTAACVDSAALSVLAAHRVGDLVVGDVAVVVAVATAHRADAFTLCHAIIDDIKTQVPIWKRQTYADGTVDWI